MLPARVQVDTGAAPLVEIGVDGFDPDDCPFQLQIFVEPRRR
jgi:hypothetical protein